MSSHGPIGESGDYQVIRSDAMNTNMIVANSSRENIQFRKRQCGSANGLALIGKRSVRIFLTGHNCCWDTLCSANVNYAKVD